MTNISLEQQMTIVAEKLQALKTLTPRTDYEFQAAEQQRLVTDELEYLDELLYVALKDSCDTTSTIKIKTAQVVKGLIDLNSSLYWKIIELEEELEMANNS